MSLYADFIRETGCHQIIEIEGAFVTYSLLGKECYIMDGYVEPAKRRRGVMHDLMGMVEQQARAAGCTALTTSTVTAIADPTSSVRTCLAYGMKVLRSTDRAVFFIKELS